MERGPHRSRTGRIKDWWSVFKTPQYQNPIYFIGYLIMVGIGLIGIFDPPRTVEGALGPLLMAALASFALIGGLNNLFSLIKGWWWLERLGLIMIAGAIVSYALTVLIMHIQSDSGTRLLQLGYITFSSVSIVSRFFIIRKWSFEPPNLGVIVPNGR